MAQRPLSWLTVVVEHHQLTVYRAVGQFPHISFNFRKELK